MARKWKTLGLWNHKEVEERVWPDKLPPVYPLVEVDRLRLKLLSLEQKFDHWRERKKEVVKLTRDAAEAYQDSLKKPGA